MHRVLFVYVDSETVSQLDGYGPMPSACLFEDGDTGRRWMLADSPITPGAWSQASEYGAAGLVRTAPLRYVAAEHVVEHREISGMLLDVPERWWVPHAGPKLPSVPLLAAALILPKSRFCNIHVHSEFSPLDGLATVQEIVDAAVADNQEFVAVTDHGYCAAHPQLSKVAQAAGVKPLFGIEANLVNNRFEVEKEIVLKPDGSSRERAHYWHFILLAMNDVGLRNLWAASSEAHITGFHGRPRMDWSTLERFNEGIIASTACLRGPLASLILSGDMEGAERMLARLISIFRDRLYVELHANHLPDQLVVNAGLVELARKFSLPTICVSDSHYACFDEQDLHQVWIAVQTDKDLTEDQDLFAGNQHYHVHSADDMVRALDYLPPSIVEESMRNTVEIGRRCTATIKQRTSMPVFHRHAVKGSTIGSGVERDVEVLRQKAEEGFALRCAHKDNAQVYRDQVEKELDLMISKGFAGYFLVVDDYCEAARSGRAHPQGKKILMGPGRGSVVGSLVAWLLGITKIDPIEADLMFERFLTPGRTSPPDIDLDFPSSERDSITNYTIDRWGADRVVRVGTHGRLKNKGVIQKVAKALSARFPVDFMHLKEISAIITAAEAHTAGAGLKWDELWEQEGELLEPFRLLYPEVFGTCDSLVKRLSSYGRHASGIVIDPEESIVDRLPLRTAGDKDNRQIVTEFDFEWLEFLGFLKFDFLTLRTLDTIQQCVDMIADDPSHGVHIDIDQWVDEYEDPQVWDMLCEGDTLGVFQIETSEGSKLVRRMQPRTIADLSAILTLVRPGPMRSGLTDSYIRRRFGEEEIVAALPELEPVLGRTYQCFAAETEVITRNGTRRIKDLHQSLGEQVMDGNGRWVDADVRWFGQQSLVKISLKRNKQTKDIFATADHRWFARWSDSKSKFVECTTDDLRPGMILRSGMPNGAQNTNLSPVGACAGIVFGDGVCTPHSTYVDLWGDKNIDLLHLFGEQRRASVESDPRCALPKVRVFDMPRSWKSHPSLDEGASFLLGWMAGYFAADGCVSKTGQAVLSSARREDLEWFRTVANVVGIGTYGITKSVTDKAPPGQPLRTATLYQVGLVASSIPDGFFLISEHADRFAASRASRVRADRTQWTVGSVEATERIEDVYCAVIPTTASFVLEDHILTGNCMIYQEDIMAVCQTLAGYDLAEADKVRAILGKKKVEEAKKEGRRFIERCKERGLDETTVEHIWAQMEEFAKYTFNRAHSWSYAVLAYWCAWLKCHYPVHFLVAVLSTIEKGRIPEFVELARRNGYTVGAPDVNESSVGFSVSGDRLGVRYGFGSIPDIGDAAAEAIIEGQPYQSWDDFLERRGPKCNWGHIRKLAAVGTFDSLLPRGQHRAALERLIEQMAEGKAIVCVHKLPGYQGPNGLPCGFNWEAEVTLGKSGKPLKQRPLPKACTRACRQYTEQDTYTWPLVDPLTEKEVRERERTALGVYLSSTPFDAVSVEYLDAEGIIYGFDAESAPFGNHVVFGMVQSIRKHVDRSGNAMAFVRINSRGYEMDVTVFSRLWFQIEHQMKKDGLALFEINRNARGSTLTNFYPINV